MLCYINVKFLTKPSGYLKLFQVIISFVCLALLRYYVLTFGGRAIDGQSFYDRELFGKTCIGGMILVTFPTLVSNLFSEGHAVLTELLHSLVGFFMFLTTGSLLLDAYVSQFSDGISDNHETKNAGIALGSLCIANALFYLLDSFFTFGKWRLQ